MRAGALRHRVTLQSVGTTYDDYGDLSDSWSTDASVWASVNPISAKEEYIAGELTGVATHEIQIRYRSGVTEQNRILFGSRVFQIESVRDWQERGVHIKILAKEVTT